MCVNIYTYTPTGILAMKNEIVPFVTTWMYLGAIMLSEISQTERQIPFDLIMWGLNKENKQTK